MTPVCDWQESLSFSLCVCCRLFPLLFITQITRLSRALGAAASSFFQIHLLRVLCFPSATVLPRHWKLILFARKIPVTAGKGTKSPSSNKWNKVSRVGRAKKANEPGKRAWSRVTPRKSMPHFYRKEKERGPPLERKGREREREGEWVRGGGSNSGRSRL